MFEVAYCMGTALVEELLLGLWETAKSPSMFILSHTEFKGDTVVGLSTWSPDLFS
jgi:hypothetical protein